MESVTDRDRLIAAFKASPLDCCDWSDKALGELADVALEALQAPQLASHRLARGRMVDTRVYHPGPGGAMKETV
jgi:hypothetical protein